jgi:hypothetical protein
MHERRAKTINFTYIYMGRSTSNMRQRILQKKCSNKNEK